MSGSLMEGDGVQAGSYLCWGCSFIIGFAFEWFGVHGAQAASVELGDVAHPLGEVAHSAGTLVLLVQCRCVELGDVPGRLHPAGSLCLGAV